MGAYLAKPETKKTSYDKNNDVVKVGVSEMQGWRVSMEDAHSCTLDYDDNLSLFAVFDGHGGAEVSTYAAENLPQFLKTMDEYKNGNLKDCLLNGFLQFDEKLISDEVLDKLREMAGMNESNPNDNEICALRDEAEIPIEELKAKLQQGGYSVTNIDDVEDDDEEYKPEIDENADCSSVRKDKEKGKEIEKKAAKKSAKVSQEKIEKESTVNGESKDDVENGADDQDEEEDDDDDDEEDSDENENDDDEDEEENQCHDGDEVGYDSGTTAIVALLNKKKLIVANVGDSRCVLCRNGIAIDMSVDHKPDDEKELKRIQNAGGKVTAEGRVNGGLNLSRAFGDHRYKGKADLGPDEQQITAFPDVKETEISDADKFMVLACDGIWNVLTSQEVVDFVSERLEAQSDSEDVSLSAICEELLDSCLASDTSGDGTGCDNMTAIIVLLSDAKNFIHKGKRKAEHASETSEVKKLKSE